MTVIYDGTELISATYMTRFVKHESVADRSLVTLPLARDDGEVLVAERYGRKLIRLQGVIRGASQSALETAIDAFTELFSRPEKNLDIDWAGGTRRFVATCIRHDFDRDHYHLSVVPWAADFVVLTGEGTDTTTTSPAEANGDLISFNGITTFGETSFPLLGSKPPRPIISLGGLFGPAVKGVEYKNTDNDQRIISTYPGDWGIGRTVTIDCLAKTVQGDVIDGVIKDMPFYGIFPSFKIGTNNVQITLGGIVNQKSHDQSLTELTQEDSLSASTAYLAQSFQVPYADSTFQGVTVALRKIGTPGSLTWRIETDNGGKPSGTLVSADATATVAAALVSTSLSYKTMYSTNAWALDSNATYWLVLKAASGDGSNRYACGFVTPGLYPRGHARNSSDSGSTWSDYTPKTDLMFRILYGGIPASTSIAHTVSYYKTYL
jgi:hypothetical protein